MPGDERACNVKSQTRQRLSCVHKSIVKRVPNCTNPSERSCSELMIIIRLRSFNKAHEFSFVWSIVHVLSSVCSVSVR